MSASIAQVDTFTRRRLTLEEVTERAAMPAGHGKRRVLVTTVWADWTGLTVAEVERVQVSSTSGRVTVYGRTPYAGVQSWWKWDEVRFYDREDAAAPQAPIVEVVGYRDPDGETSVDVFLDGVRIDAYISIVDPGAGGTSPAWRVGQYDTAARLSPAAGEAYRALLVDCEMNEGDEMDPRCWPLCTGHHATGEPCDPPAPPESEALPPSDDLDDTDDCLAIKIGDDYHFVGRVERLTAALPLTPVIDSPEQCDGCGSTVPDVSGYYAWPLRLREGSRVYECTNPECSAVYPVLRRKVGETVL